MVQSKPFDLCQHEKRKLKNVEKEKNELGEILKNYNLSSKALIEQKQKKNDTAITYRFPPICYLSAKPTKPYTRRLVFINI